MITLVLFLVTQTMLHSIQPDFIQKKLHNLAAYKSFLESASEESIKFIKDKRIKYATHDNRTQFDSLLGSNRIDHEARITISDRQKKINESHYQHFLKEIDSLLFNVLPHALCQLIAEYEFTSTMIMETYEILGVPIVGIYPTNNSHTIILMGEADDKELDAVLYDSQNNSIIFQSTYEWNHWKDFLIKKPQALPYHQQKFVDFDQSDENVAAIDETNVMIWNNNISYEEALSHGHIKLVKETMNITGMGNDICNLTTSVRFSSCGESLIIGETDGLIKIFDIATGDAAYSIVYNKSVTALGVSPNGPLLIGFEDGTIDALRYQCTHIPDNQSFESAVSPMPEPMTMEEYDPSYRPRDIANALCIYDCLDCLTHTKTLCKTCGQCCCTGISCLSSCPIFCWALSRECYYCCLSRCRR